MKEHKYSVVVIGSGISGLYSALKINQEISPQEGVLLITKSHLEDCNSYYAQGGMVAVLKNNKDDSVDLHVNDTLKAGAGLSEKDTVEFISKNSDIVVRDLLNFGLDFDRDENGEFTLTKEAAHSVRRILHSDGDATGREMEKSLIKAVINQKNISIKENSMAVKLLVENNVCYGVLIFNQDLKIHEVIYSDTVVLATGGIGQIFQYTTNPICATGDGIALSYDAGAILQDLEFIQFHPTALAFDDKNNQNRFLISEAVRGEGAKLCNKDGYEYMSEYDSRKELAPRDIVARANFSQMQKLNTPNMYLNATVINSEKLLNRFPNIRKKCLEYGIDILKDYIPVAPASHYFMGGIKTDIYGKTSIENLYAVGEVASTGLHGANRLASNSILECVVCAYEIAKYLKNQNTTNHTDADFSHININFDNEPGCKIKNLCDLKQKLKKTMWDNAGIFRSKKSLDKALQDLNEISNEVGNRIFYLSKEEYELKNMITTAKLIVKSASNREESRGAHYRIDFPHTNNIAMHSLVKKEKGEIYFVK